MLLARPSEGAEYTAHLDEILSEVPRSGHGQLVERMLKGDEEAHRLKGFQAILHDLT